MLEPLRIQLLYQRILFQQLLFDWILPLRNLAFQAILLSTASNSQQKKETLMKLERVVRLNFTLLVG